MDRHSNHPGEFSTRPEISERLRAPDELHARARAIQVLQEAEVPFVVGGAYAYATYTGIFRDTKDLDLFPTREGAERALEVLADDGWRTERTEPLWLYKAFKGEWFVDLIFSSGNGVATVDDAWFEHARAGLVFGRKCLVAPPEEMIWSKAFVLERERYDGADVAHLIKCAGAQLDWRRMLSRFDRYWEVLLAHLLKFRFAFPGERTAVPAWVMKELLGRASQSVEEGDWEAKLCRGNLLSRVNYSVAIEHWGYVDGRRWDEGDREGGLPEVLDTGEGDPPARRDEGAEGSGLQVAGRSGR